MSSRNRAIRGRRRLCSDNRVTRRSRSVADSDPARSAVLRDLHTTPTARSCSEATRVRMWLRGAWDLEPFGRLSFRFQGHASGHVVSLILVDLQGNEKLLWRHRDVRTEHAGTSKCRCCSRATTCLTRATSSRFAWSWMKATCESTRSTPSAGSLLDLDGERRDVIVPPRRYAAALSEARQKLAATATGRPPRPADRLVAPRFQPWTRPVVPEEHPRFAQSDPQPVTRRHAGLRAALHRVPAPSTPPHSTTITSTTTLATSAGRISAPARSERITRRTRTMPPRSQAWSSNSRKSAAGGSMCSISGATCRSTTITRRELHRNTARS